MTDSMKRNGSYYPDPTAFAALQRCALYPRTLGSQEDLPGQIKHYLQQGGWFVVKVHPRWGKNPGIADLYALKNGRHVWIEVKVPQRKKGPAQQMFQGEIERHGGQYLVACGLEDVKHWEKKKMGTSLP